MKKIKRFITCAALISSHFMSAQFTMGNLVVFQAGDGVATLTNTGNPIVINEFNTSGIMTFSMLVPSNGTNALITSGSATSEGILSLSADNKYIVFGAYAKSLPNTLNLSSSAASIVTRAIGVIDGNGGFTIGAISNSFHSTNNMRGAAATNSTNLWSAGGNDGTNYFGTASTATNVQNAKTNSRAVSIFNNQLYFSSQSTAGTPTLVGIYSVGTNTPNTSGQTVTNIINTGSGSQPSQFYFDPTGTICYVADTRNSSLGGIQKWVFSSSTWSLAYTLPTITGTATVGAFGVVADFSTSTPIIYATTMESSANRLISIADIGANSTPTTLATATTSNTIFRGLAFSPCGSAGITNVTSSPGCSNSPLFLNVTPSGSGPFTYTWTGSGSFSSNSISNPTVTNATSSIYSVTVGNACGIATNTVNVIINPSPTINIVATPTAVCAGNSAVLTSSGTASTFSWSTGSNGTTTSFSANVTGIVSLTTSIANCIKINSITITVNSLPTITVNAPTICVGSSTALVASGAFSYTWNTGAINNSITVSPTVTTNYTVDAISSQGCANTITTSISVSPCTGISLYNSDISFVNVYPNPSNQNLTIKTQNSDLFNVNIIDALGKSVYVCNNLENNSQINIEHLATGLYTLQIQKNGSVITYTKFSKQ